MNRHSSLSIESTLMWRKRAAQRNRIWLGLITRLLTTALAMHLALGVVMGISRVHGCSMRPYARCGDIAVFSRIGAYQAGDVVVLRRAGEPEHLIKRIIAVAGDTLDIDGAVGHVLLNGHILEENYVFFETHARAGGVHFPIQVPEGSVFLLGDNRPESRDSREFGAVSEKQITGKVIIMIRTSWECSKCDVCGARILRSGFLGRGHIGV